MNFAHLKTALLSLLAAATLAGAQASEPLLFTAHLTGNTDATADGTFTLTGNVFSYRVLAFYP